MKQTKSQPRIGLGTASLLTVFAVLCLAVFAVLALVVANEQMQLAEKSAQAITDYYNADSGAVDMANELWAMYESGNLTDTDQLQDIGITAEIAPDSATVGYRVLLDEFRELSVELFFTEQGITVSKWQVVPFGDWAPDTSIEVWIPDFPIIP